MATTWTEYGLQEIMKVALNGATQPTGNATFHLLDSATNLTKDAGAATWSGGTGIAADELGSAGYSSVTVAINGTNFVVAEDGSTDGQQEIQIANVVFTASGGDITAAEGAAMVVGDRVWAVFDFTAPVTVTSGGTLTLQNCELQLAI
jgi:hypothetical protein